MPPLPRHDSSWAGLLCPDQKGCPHVSFGWSLSGHLWVALSWPSGPWVLAAPGLASCELKSVTQMRSQDGDRTGELLACRRALLPGSEPEEVFYGPRAPGFAAKGVGPVLWLSVEQV